MNSSKAIGNLKDILKTLEREKESLKHILLSGKISHETFDLLEKRIEGIITVASKLEEALKEEESFWKERLLDGIRIFETLLVELELERLLGRIEQEEYLHNSEIINTGLSSIKNQIEQEGRTEEKNSMPPQPSKSGYANEEKETRSNNPCIQQYENSTRRNRRATKMMAEDERQGESKVHCMNPWNPECRSTDIEVSIYYKGRMVPICHRCWEEIANRDVEWSSF